ncbi:MAG TPA: Trp biosynthesis-associated membrane protein [Actinophytocola sp.]|jgi:MFS family permease|uniref:Trp biosynthesis-associated membrane protein n=1 Tax=Actinophytocola sp. TaxID=1872138 RepID=UPI002F957F5D
MTRRAPLWIVALLLAGAAAALWGSTRLTWGTDVTPRFGVGVALVALAGFAGTVAVGGWGRRVVGAVVVLAGLLAGWAVLAEGGTGGGRWIALLGAVLLVVAGIVVIRLAARLPTLGARYRSANARRASGDGDKDMWDGLSHGEDPTVSNVEDDR